METAKTILIADDNKDIVEATTAILKVVGYEVISTYNGNSVPKIAQTKPDLILLDAWIPEIDGRVICKKLKSDPETKNIPVIIFSASTDIRQSVLDSGADDFLEKPFDMHVLIQKIEKLTAKPLDK